MSGAHRRIRSAHRQDQYGPERHSIFVDDKIWLTTRANTCVLIARAWQQATALLNLGENASKADFNAFGHKNNAEALQGHQSSWGPRNYQSKDANLGYIHATQPQG
jgi:hypothetical protein